MASSLLLLLLLLFYVESIDIRTYYNAAADGGGGVPLESMVLVGYETGLFDDIPWHYMYYIILGSIGSLSNTKCSSCKAYHSLLGQQAPQQL